MFGDDIDPFVEKFEQLLEDATLEDFLEEEDLLPSEALYYLFLAGYVKNPFDR